MRLRNWLLAGSSLGILALAPMSAQAQDAGLVAAFERYIEASSSGDPEAAAAAEAALSEACGAAGFGSIDECISAIQGGGAAPAEEEAPPAEEPPAEEPPPVEEPVPEEPPAVEEPAPEEPVIEEVPEPEVQEAPPPEVLEQEPPPEPEPEETPVPEEQIAPEQPQEPAVEEQLQIEEALPEEVVPEEPTVEEVPAETIPEELLTEEPAPEVETQQEAPAEELTQEPAPEAPAAQQESPPAEEGAPGEVSADVTARLVEAVDLYNQGFADYIGGNTDAGGNTMSEAQARIAEICAEAGFATVDECLAQNGLELPQAPGVQPGDAPVPAEQPAPQDQPAPAVEPAPVQEPAVTQEAPTAPEAGQPPVEAIPQEPVETLPEDVSPEEAAPLFDSAKEELLPAPEGAQPVEQGAAPAPEQPAPEQPAEAAPPAPPPTSDADAQSQVQVEVNEAAIVEEQGEQIAAPPAPELPPNVTIINNVTNTTVNNTTVTNNTTVNNNNTTVNTGDITNNQVIVQYGNQLVIRNPTEERDRFMEDQDEVFYEQLPGGRVRETIERPDGTRIITVRNRYGDTVRRVRITPDGREYVLAYVDEDDRDELREWRDPGEDLPPLRLNISVDEYVLDVEEADEEEVEVFFRQPPVEQVRRLYSIDEVKRSARVRDSVRRLEVGGLTFDTGKATISRDQVGTLSKVATAMQQLLEANPAETFLIEGHTDAVGSDISNLSLSDARASTVARILSDFYDIPPENLATQGYGERYLKVRTEESERANRRVTIRRITPLVTPVASR